MFAAVKRLWEECDDDDLKSSAESLVSSLGANSAELMGDDVDVLIEQYLSGEKPTQISESMIVLTRASKAIRSKGCSLRFAS